MVVVVKRRNSNLPQKRRSKTRHKEMFVEKYSKVLWQMTVSFIEMGLVLSRSYYLLFYCVYVCRE